MARFSTTIPTPLSPDAAFAYMADLTNLAVWDPGVARAVLVKGDGPGLSAAYDVTVTSGMRTTLRYEVVRYEPPRTLRLVARTRLLLSVDDVTVAPAEHGEGALVTYDAALTLAGPLRLLDRGLQVFFDRLGRRAAEGLRRALGAT
jgi:hypothetical protein